MRRGWRSTSYGSCPGALEMHSRTALHCHPRNVSKEEFEISAYPGLFKNHRSLFLVSSFHLPRLMVPTPRSLQSLNNGVGARSSRLLYTLLSCATQVVPKLFHSGPANDSVQVLAKRKFDGSQPKYIVFAVLIPVLVLLSGLFAGLTLGYMSLDETQLNVLCISGTPYVSMLFAPFHG